MTDRTFEPEHDRPSSKEAAASWAVAMSPESPEPARRHMRMRATHFGRSRIEIGRAPLAAAIAMFAIVFVLRLMVHDTGNGLSMLYCIPIALITITYGTAAGAAAATLAVGLVYLWIEMKSVQIGAIGIGTRTLALYIVPATIWLARADPAEEPEPALSSADTGDANAVAPRGLTRRESEVLGLIAAGHTNAEIAEQLVLSVRTIESHRANLQRKLGRPSRPELVNYALRLGVVPGQRRLPF